jgi:hypothetical protein
MSKKSLMGIIAAIAIIAVILVLFLSKLNHEQSAENNQEEQEPVVTKESLDESMKSTIEELKPTCEAFLAGDINGIDSCSEFDKEANRGLCYYCFAVKNQDSSLCEKIIQTSPFKMICKRATGSTIDDIIGN